ncbi:hypothetical protein K7103_000557, partial [Vibrio parahaemolyticus]|nr:hypothetical protein [Vibrio parahaemolyticus]
MVLLVTTKSLTLRCKLQDCLFIFCVTVAIISYMLLPLSSKIINLLFRFEYILINVGLILSLEPNMTWEILNQKPTESNARDVVVLNRFSNFLGQFDIDPRILDKREVKITRQAILVIQAMTDFDRKNVIKDIYKIIDNPKRASLTKHRR